MTPDAESDVKESFRYIHDRSPANAERRLRQINREIQGLELFPERYASARERAYLEEDLRHLIFKSHRVVFYLDKASATVYVLHVRHSRRLAVGEPPDEDE